MKSKDSPSPDFVDALLRAALACERSGEIGGAAGSAEEPIPESIDRFRVIERIGLGGIGEVYRVFDPILERAVALKVLRPRAAKHADLLESFVAEAKIAGSLEHPGIVPLHEYGTLADGRPYFTMRVIGGRTLATLIEEAGPALDSRLRHLGVLASVARTLAFAHARGIIHGDVKPHNVMVGEFGEVQVIDWGFARAVGRPEDDDRGDGPRLLGTPAYMAPEQARGDVAEVDARTDVFGLGAILVEILTGRPPHVASTRDEVVRIATEADQEELRERLARSGVDSRLIGLARGCLAVERDRRPRDASFVVSALESYFAGEAERVRRAEIEVERANARVESERRARVRTIALGGSLVLAVAIAASVIDRSRRDRALQRAANDLAASRAVEEARHAVARASEPRSRLDPEAWEHARQVAREAGRFVRQNECDASLEVAAIALESTTDREVSRIELANATLRRLETIFHRLLDDRDDPRLESEFTAAFVAHGIDVATLGVEDAAARIRADLLGPTLTLALDHWARMRRRAAAGDPARALPLFDVAIASDPDPWRREVRAAIRDGDPAQLSAIAERGIPSGQPAGAHLLIAQGLLDLSRRDAALSILRPAVLEFPNDYWLCHGYATVLERSTPLDIAEVVRLHSMAHALRPNDPHVLVDLARAHSLAGRRETARKLLEKAVVVDPKSARAWLFLGTTFDPHDERDRAVAALRRAFDLGAAAAGLLLSDHALDDGRPVRAFDFLRTTAAAFPADPIVAVAFARSAIENFAYADALARLDVALSADPDHAEANLLRAYCRLRLGDPEGAVTGLSAARERIASGDDADLLAMCDSMLGEARHVADVERSLASDPEHGVAALHGAEVTTQAAFANLLALVVLDRPTAAMCVAEGLLSRPGTDRGFGLRFTAARAAARLATGEGEEGAALSLAQRSAALRRAAEWLDADLDAIESKLDSDPTARKKLRSTLQVWSLEPNFVRLAAQDSDADPSAREAWARTWTRLAKLSARADADP